MGSWSAFTAASSTRWYENPESGFDASPSKVCNLPTRMCGELLDFLPVTTHVTAALMLAKNSGSSDEP